MEKLWIIREHGRYDIWDTPAIPNDRKAAVEQAKTAYNQLSTYDKKHRLIEAILLFDDEDCSDVYQVAWSSEQ